MHMSLRPGKDVLSQRQHACMHLLVPGQTNYRVMNDANTLVAAGYRVTIVDVVAQRKIPRLEHCRGLDFIHIVAPSWFMPSHFKFWFVIKMVFLWLRCLYCLVRVKADVYHAHVEHAFPATYLVARLRRKRLIFDTPELTMSGPTIRRWPLLRRAAITIIRKMSLYCDMHITGSPLYAPVLAELYGNERMCVIRHIPPYQRVMRSKRLHQRLSLPSSTRIALYQGYLQPDRGLALLVQAAHYLPPDVVIVMMGNNYGTTEADLRVLIQQEQLDERVKITPAVPYDHLLEWTAAADIGLILLPPDYSESIRKCLPNKFFECLMAGLPIVSSRIDAVAEFVSLYSVGVVVDVLTPEHIGKAITELINNPDQMARMREHVLYIVRENGLYWEEEQKKLLDCYQSICPL